ncbi:hypothetical protein GUJ93_ZPchr0257g6573 [Zizania palustris]|uniref:Uncharacterized protein n=1 Tax=Zizania palustris TaxID=103762 RepID=A0A8J5RE77_ZIZPA|nr:hypothetical protein GUJ93_ZPchr0257g6573 [Zizania palustris]
MSLVRRCRRKLSRAPQEKQPARSALLTSSPRGRLLVTPNRPGQARVPLPHCLGQGLESPHRHFHPCARKPSVCLRKAEEGRKIMT